MPAPEWRGAPTGPGDYHTRGGRLGTRIVRVWLRIDGVLRLRTDGGVYSPTDFPEAEWLGPLPSPDALLRVDAAQRAWIEELAENPVEGGPNRFDEKGIQYVLRTLRAQYENERLLRAELNMARDALAVLRGEVGT